MYPIIRSILFQFDPEKIHHTVTALLKTFLGFSLVRNLVKKSFSIDHPELKREVFGLSFNNPVGLAAGFDKNAQHVEEFAALGFGFIEIGTVTPLPQPGNEKPRMFRLPADEALINRMGFNNQGVDVVADRLKRVKREGLIIGGNIGKNKNTPNEDAVKDYLICFERLFDVVDYFVVNVSSPNTPGLRALQEKEPLLHILNSLQAKNNKEGVSRPILLKIAPDLSEEQLDDIVSIVEESKIAGLIATNTTVSREDLHASQVLKEEAGGLSGKPLANRSTYVIAYLHRKSKGKFPIIGVGGIHSAAEAIEKIKAGACLVQVYTGFIYEGPGLIKAINQEIVRQKA